MITRIQERIEGMVLLERFERRQLDRFSLPIVISHVWLLNKVRNPGTCVSCFVSVKCKWQIVTMTCLIYRGSNFDIFASRKESLNLM